MTVPDVDPAEPRALKSPLSEATSRLRVLILPLGGLVLVAAAMWIRDAMYGVDQWNPYPIERAAIVGDWKDGGSRLALHADSTYTLDADGLVAQRIGRTASRGLWRLEDYNLLLLDQARGTGHQMKVIVARGEYRIVVSPPDLDMWDGWLGLRRTVRSPAPSCDHCE